MAGSALPEEGVAGGVSVLAEDGVNDDLPFLVVPAVGDHPIARTEVHGPSLEGDLQHDVRRAFTQDLLELHGRGSGVIGKPEPELLVLRHARNGFAHRRRSERVRQAL